MNDLELSQTLKKLLNNCIFVRERIQFIMDNIHNGSINMFVEAIDEICVNLKSIMKNCETTFSHYFIFPTNTSDLFILREDPNNKRIDSSSI